MKNNSYLIYNNNDFNHLIISNMILVVNNINQKEIKNVLFNKMDKKN